jgi:choline dehydrogenase-like flavoprotein
MSRDQQRVPSYDVVVVGGGAAGLSAALVLGRARRQIAVVDAGAPRNAPAAHMQGYLSRDGMSPADLLAAGRIEVTGYGVELVEDQVVAIETGFVVRLGSGRVLKARRLLVATGVRDELPRGRRACPSIGRRPAIQAKQPQWEASAAFGVTVVGTVITSDFPSAAGGTWYSGRALRRTEETRAAP